MALEFQAPDWQKYVMNWHAPHRSLEPLAQEIAVVDEALDALVAAGILPHKEYSHDKMLAHRAAVRERFDIPWTAISPRMQRLLYAINAIAQPQTMVAVGIFCGNTFVSNAGAAIGPGACYEARYVAGFEIRAREADRARRNVIALADPEHSHIAGNGFATDSGTQVDVLGADGLPWLRDYAGVIDLLYLDADGPRGVGKSIYLTLLQAAEHALQPGSIVLAHNSVNDARGLADYLSYVRDPDRYAQSINMFVDDQGLEVSQR
jgi:predicted O-methyltransferase YrrM